MRLYVLPLSDRKEKEKREEKREKRKQERGERKMGKRQRDSLIVERGKGKKEKRKKGKKKKRKKRKKKESSIGLSVDHRIKISNAIKSKWANIVSPTYVNKICLLIVGS